MGELKRMVMVAEANAGVFELCNDRQSVPDKCGIAVCTLRLVFPRQAADGREIAAERSVELDLLRGPVPQIVPGAVGRNAPQPGIIKHLLGVCRRHFGRVARHHRHPGDLHRAVADGADLLQALGKVCRRSRKVPHRIKLGGKLGCVWHDGFLCGTPEGAYAFCE